ncbi:MAG: AmmeMemoRadiSam system protein B [Bullifex sp.]
MNFFRDIFYPSDEEKLKKLTEFSKEDVTYPMIIIPHAGLEYVHDVIKAGFSHLRPAERYVFIAPLHNGAFPDSREYLFTISDRTVGNVSVRKVSGPAVEDAILEEEYSLELTLPFFRWEESPVILPIFTSITTAEQVKGLRKVIERLDDGSVSFVISANMASEGKEEKMKEQADRLEGMLASSTPLLEEGRKGNISGCALQIAAALRGLYTSYIPIMEGKNTMHRAGAFK